jgi:hypothetical protein
MGANSFPILRQLSAHALHPAVGGTSMAALVCWLDLIEWG